MKPFARILFIFLKLTAIIREKWFLMWGMHSRAHGISKSDNRYPYHCKKCGHVARVSKANHTYDIDKHTREVTPVTLCARCGWDEI